LCRQRFFFPVKAIAGVSSFYTPNSFTPNGDGLNDIFSVSNTGLGDFKGRIYNRWGALIYEWDSAIGGWDGKTKGKNAPEGVYYFIIEASDLCRSVSYEKSGAITLFR